MSGSTWNLILGALVIVFGLRLVVYVAFKKELKLFEEVVKEAQGILNRHGSTVGQLKGAGVYGHLCDLEKKGGQFYREAVPLAAFLMWWPIGPLLQGGAIRRAFASGGLCGPEQMGAYEVWGHFRLGFARDDDYYPVSRIKGMLSTLRLTSFFG